MGEFIPQGTVALTLLPQRLNLWMQMTYPVYYGSSFKGFPPPPVSARLAGGRGAEEACFKDNYT